MIPWRCVWEVSAWDVDRFLKSVTGFCPRSMPTKGHLPPSASCTSWCRSLNVMLCLCVLKLAVNLHPLRMCVFVRGE